MNFKSIILDKTSAEEIDQLFKTALTAAGEKHSEQIIVANLFCTSLEELIADGKIAFPSGGVDFMGFGGGRVPMFRPNTVVQIKK